MTSMGELNIVDNVVPSGSWKLVKIENVKFLAYF